VRHFSHIWFRLHYVVLLVCLLAAGLVLPAISQEGPPDHARKTPKASALLKTGRRLLVSGKAESALTYFEKYVAENPKDAEGYFWVGTSLLDSNRSEESVLAFRKALELNAENGTEVAQLRVNLGNALMMVGKHDQAIKEYRRAIEVEPTEPRAHFNLARALLRLDVPYLSAIAISHLDKAEDLGLKIPDLYRYRAGGYLQLRKNEDALGELEKYVKLLPQKKPSWLLQRRQPKTMWLQDYSTWPRL